MDDPVNEHWATEQRRTNFKRTVKLYNQIDVPVNMLVDIQEVSYYVLKKYLNSFDIV